MNVSLAMGDSEQISAKSLSRGGERHAITVIRERAESH
jgi:hypothetical protein